MTTGQVECNTRSDQIVAGVEYLYSYQYIIDNSQECVKQTEPLPGVIKMTTSSSWQVDGHEREWWRAWDAKALRLL